ncbi:cadmium-translocating P-type ATPase [Candidatus Kaiserbacteria bacterium]|nr:cadmium-translocating P-type ATPase [Candidatus Kaiserbacteria bacterium]
MNHHDAHSCHTKTYKNNSHAQNGAHAMSHGSAQEYLRRFWIVTFLLIPLLFTNDAVTGFAGIGTLPFSRWIGFGIATVIFSFALVFFRHASHEIKARKYGMMTLVSIAVGAGYLFSVASTFISTMQTEFYLEISTLIWVLLFGHYLEARSSSAAGDALAEVAKLLPKKAHRLSGTKEEDVDITELAEKDIVLVKPGEKIPADGVIQEGTANIDESLISGESKPVEKKEGDTVVAGSICLDGSLTVMISRVGERSTIGQIQKLISDAQGTKPRSQRIADRASAVLVFIAGITAFFTILVWSVFLDKPFVFAITLAITVLVIACPHALGLAIPTVTTITTSLAVKNGVFIKNLAKIEVIKKADYVVFDKTGTLTRGEFGVHDAIPTADVSAGELIAIAASIERHSSHIVGQAIVRYAQTRGLPDKEVKGVKNIAGKGMKATVDGTAYAAGNRALMHDLHVADEDAEKRAHKLADRGETVVYIADNKRIIGLIALADSIKPESYKTVKNLHALGVKVAMLTGDNKNVAESVAEELGIDTYFSEVLPEDKYIHIKKLQEKGNVVLMVGDGVNDAPALTQADVGIAIGAGTDVAVEAGDVVLTRNNPQDISRLLVLSRKVYGKMIQNLAWALGYNIVAIPAAAGVFAAWGFFLRPEIGALLMSLSTVIVVINAMTLKRVSLETS